MRPAAGLLMSWQQLMGLVGLTDQIGIDREHCQIDNCALQHHHVPKSITPHKRPVQLVIVWGSYRRGNP
jgi:hypothetical protein